MSQPLTKQERDYLRQMATHLKMDVLIRALDQIEALEQQIELQRPYISEVEDEFLFEFRGNFTKKISMYTKISDLFKSTGAYDDMPDIPLTQQDIRDAFDWLYKPSLNPQEPI
jgi:hypothetical protein